MRFRHLLLHHTSAYFRHCMDDRRDTLSAEACCCFRLMHVAQEAADRQLERDGPSSTQLVRSFEVVALLLDSFRCHAADHVIT